MGIRRTLIYIIGTAALTALFCARVAHAQPQPQMSYCLNAAHDHEISAFKKNKKYELDENELKRNIPFGCRGYTYIIELKGESGFKVTTEINGESWAVDEKSNFFRMARAGAKAQAFTPPKRDGPKADNAAGTTPLKPESGAAPAAGPPPAPKQGIFSQAANAGNQNAGGGGGKERVPMAVLASDNIQPLIESAPLEIPTLTSILNPTVTAILRPEDEAKQKLEKCFSKRLYPTKACENLFTDLEKECARKVDKDKIPVMCVEYTRRVSDVQLDNCDGDEENWGQCELRAKQMGKYCANPLKENSSECRALRKYLAKTPSGKPNPVNRGIAQTDLGEGYGTAGFNVDFTSIELLKNVQNLGPSLRKVLTLRPVSYELRDGRRKDVGFVAEEVEAVDETLVTYSSSSKLQGVRYPQLTTLLTSGLQELYGMCKSDIDLNKDLIRKVVALQDENAELRKKLEKQQKDLLIIKEKLGLK